MYLDTVWNTAHGRQPRMKNNMILVGPTYICVS